MELLQGSIPNLAMAIMKPSCRKDKASCSRWCCLFGVFITDGETEAWNGEGPIQGY